MEHSSVLSFLPLAILLLIVAWIVIRFRRDAASAASRQGRLLIVSYTERGESVRLISAREVTLSERKAYEEG